MFAGPNRIVRVGALFDAEDIVNDLDPLAAVELLQLVLDQLVDEDCGVVNAAVRDTLARLASEQPAKLIYVDSRRFLGKFSAATLKGNRSEVLSAVHSRDQRSRSRCDPQARRCSGASPGVRRRS